MKTFLSWSGERSKSVATAFRDWLPLVLHYTRPWLSERDIAAGERWAVEIGKELEGTQFGIIVLTRDNLDAPWILFEAGALSKAFSVASVCPYLVDLELKDIAGPLAQFQAKKSDRESTLELLQAINSKADTPIEAARLAELFDALWPRLEARLKHLPTTAPQAESVVRSSAEIMEELVGATRRIETRLDRLENLSLSIYEADETTWRSPRKIRIAIAGDFPLVRGASEIELSPTVDLLHDVAQAIGVNIKEYQKTWWLQDPNGKDIARSEGRLLARHPPRVNGPAFTVTDLPF